MQSLPRKRFEAPMKKSGPLAFLAVVGVALSLGAASGPRSKPDQKETGKTSLNIRVTPAMAFAPARIVLRAELKGGADDNENLYCPTIEWDWGDGTVSESSSDCEPYEPKKSEIQRSFITEHVYKFGGDYTVQLRLKRQNKVVALGAASVNIGAALGENSDIIR